MSSNGTITLFGCGGAGINQVAFFNNADQEPNCANIHTGYVDASHSNMRDDFNKDDIFLLDNVDGSGKVRKENHQEIANVVKQILLQIQPGDLNVVVFSASGG